MFDSNDLVKEMDGLRKFALRLTGNQAEADDLLQSTMCRALEKKHLFQEGTSLFKWTSKMMFNLFASQYRRKVKFESQYDPEPVIDRQSSQPRQEGRMQAKQVREAMDDMSKDHAQILTMVCIKGMKYKTVADKLDMPVGTVRSRLSRARQQLQEDLTTKYAA